MKSNKKTNSKVEILIAEDSPTQAARLAHLLEEHGYAVTTATNGREALALLDRSMPTLIISDVLMPELDGYGLCKAIKATEKWKHILVMLVTTLSDALDVVRGLECGADNFIRKPYDEKYLLSRVDYLLMNLELRKNQKMQMGLEISLGGQRHFINSERQQILDLLISTYEQAVNINDELKTREKELARSNQVLNGLYRIAEGLNHAVSEREVVELALERALELPGIQAGWISLREGETGFRLAAARNLPPALEVPGAMEGDCACRRRLVSGELDSVTNILECERLQKATGDTRELLYHASVPLWLGDRTLGVMNLVGPEKGLFSEDELKVLYGVGNQLAVALERARLSEHLEKLVEERTARIIRLNRIYAVLSGINTAIVRVQERQRLFEEACSIAVEQGKFTFAWIGTLDASTQQVTPVARSGRDDGYLSQINLTTREDAPGNCELTARAFASAAPVVCNDIASDERMKTWRAEALSRGYRSVALFPLVLDGQPIGVFVLYAPEPGVFDEEEMGLLVEMAGDISFALDHLRKEELLEQRTTALTAEIAERKRIEQEQARLVAIIEATPDFVATSAPDGKVLYCNQAGLRMLGYEPGHDASALKIREAHPEWAGKLVVETGIPYAIEHGSWAGETAFVRTDGREVPLSQVIVAHRGPDGSVEYLSTIARDMTARHEAEEQQRRTERQLEQMQRVSSLGRVAATIAHEFNNVLMGIQPFAEVIRRNTTADEKVQKAATQIMSSVSRGKRVTQEILRFSQPSEPALQLVVLADWLQQLAPELRAMIGQRINIDIEKPPRPVVARCDPMQLQQVLTNLVLNARDAMPNGGTITLITADSGDQRQFSFGRIPGGKVLLAVRDTGSGMLPEVRQSIFEPLFTTKRSGTGLGLAVAQQIIERHGGSIHVDTAPDEGTTFFLLLPVAEQAAVQQGQKRATSTPVRRVLLVEDEPAVAAGITALLEGEGIEVRAVERGAEAPDAAESFRPDAVILDLSLPDISGLDVYVSLKTIAPDLPIIFSSGHADQAALEQQIDSSTVAFLRKPYELEALLEALQKVVEEQGRGAKR